MAVLHEVAARNGPKDNQNPDNYEHSFEAPKGMDCLSDDRADLPRISLPGLIVEFQPVRIQGVAWQVVRNFAVEADARQVAVRRLFAVAYSSGDISAGGMQDRAGAHRNRNADEQAGAGPGIVFQDGYDLLTAAAVPAPAKPNQIRTEKAMDAALFGDPSARA